MSEFADCEEEVAFIRDYVASANDEMDSLKVDIKELKEAVIDLLDIAFSSGVCPPSETRKYIDLVRSK